MTVGNRTIMAVSLVAVLCCCTAFAISDSGCSDAEPSASYDLTAVAGTHCSFDTNIPSGYSISNGSWSLADRLPLGMSINSNGDLEGTPTVPGYYSMNFYQNGEGNTANTLSGKYVHVNLNVTGEPPQSIGTSVNSPVSVSIGADTDAFASYQMSSGRFEVLSNRLGAYFGDPSETGFDSIGVYGGSLCLEDSSIEGGISITPTALDFVNNTHTESTDLFGNITYSNGKLSFRFDPSSSGTYAIGLHILAEGPGYSGGYEEFILTNVFVYGGSGTVVSSVSFDANGGTGNVDQQNIINGNRVSLPTAGFVKNGSYLSGWRLNSVSGVHYDLGTGYTVAGDARFFAEWTSIPSDLDEHAPSTGMIGRSYSYSPTTGTSDFWVVWNAIVHAQGLNNVRVIEDKMPSWLHGSYSSVLPSFSGTPTAAGVFEVRIHMSCPNSDLDQNTYVSWIVTVSSAEENERYSISFEPNGGTMKEGSTVSRYDGLTLNSAVNLPGVSYDKQGYSHVAWSTMLNGVTVYYPVGSLYTVTGDTIFTAVFTADPNIIILDANGGMADNGTLYSAYIAYTDGTISLPSSGFSKSGSTFRGWYEASDPTSIYAPGFLMTVSGTVTMKAYYVQSNAETHQVTFNANGGTGGLSQVVESGKGVIMPKYGFDRSGHTLVGWTVNGTSGTEYAPNGRCVVSTQTTMFAKWVADEVPPRTFAVIFDLNGGTGNVPVQNVASGAKVSEPVPPVRQGHLFDCWKVVGGTEWDFNAPVVTSMTLQAQWVSHFTTSSDGTTVTVMISNAYAGRYTSVSWGDGAADSGNKTVFVHDYQHTSSGMISVTTLDQGSEYRSVMTYSVTSPGGRIHYNVTFDTNGIEGIPTPAIQSVESGRCAVDPNVPSNGQRLSWTLNGSPYDFSSPVTSNMTLVLKASDDIGNDGNDRYVIVAAALLIVIVLSFIVAVRLL